MVERSKLSGPATDQRRAPGAGRRAQPYYPGRRRPPRVKDIEVSLSSKEFGPGEIIRGTVRVSYGGRFDGVVVNTQVLDSNELVVYRSYAGKEIEKKTSRLFIPRDLMSGSGAVAEFTASVELASDRAHDVKFRASIIEQHKEVESDILFARLAAAGAP